MISISMPKAYGVQEIDRDTGMSVLKEMFPEGEATDYQFVLFGTSGVHGSYCMIDETINDLGTEDESGLTVMIIHHRTVFVQYGTISITKEDGPFLHSLRESSIRAVERINCEG